jgi:hypothetical protein
MSWACIGLSKFRAKILRPLAARDTGGQRALPVSRTHQVLFDSNARLILEPLDSEGLPRHIGIRFDIPCNVVFGGSIECGAAYPVWRTDLVLIAKEVIADTARPTLRGRQSNTS